MSRRMQTSVSSVVAEHSRAKCPTKKIAPAKTAAKAKPRVTKVARVAKPKGTARGVKRA